MLSPSLLAFAAILALTTAAPLDSSSLTKRDGATFILTVNDVEGTMPAYNNTRIKACNGGFCIGNSAPTTLCPPSGPCPVGGSTVFQCVADNTNSTCYLSTLSGKQSLFFNENGALSYVPSAVYGHWSPSVFPFFEHSGDQFLATQFYGTNNQGAFWNENWFGCAATKNSDEQVPYQLYFALSAGNNCGTDAAWIEITATQVVGGPEVWEYAN